VNKYAPLSLVGTFNKSEEAYNRISKRNDIGLVILDVQMIGEAGFNFFSKLEYSPMIIAVSSDGELALKSFELNVADYLIKPVSYWRFIKAIDKAIIKSGHREAAPAVSREIFIKKGTSLVKLNLSEIIYIEALENYVTLNTRNEKFTIHFTMKALENHLPPDIFIRVHRSLIINKNLIQTIDDKSLNLNVGDSLKSFPVGRSFREPLLGNLSLIAR